MNRRTCIRPALVSLECRISRAMALSLLLGVAFSVATMQCAYADDAHKSMIYDSNGFEPKPFVAGFPLLGFDGWSTAIPPFLNPDAAMITDTDSATGRQSVEVWGGDLVGSEGITAPYDRLTIRCCPVNRSWWSRRNCCSKRKSRGPRKISSASPLPPAPVMARRWERWGFHPLVRPWRMGLTPLQVTRQCLLRRLNSTTGIE
jgi:hypothetical protein